jgi:hypothetical protein
MSNERLKHLGRLEEKKENAKKLRLKIEGLRDAMRENLDQFEPVEDLKLDVVAEQAFEIRNCQIELIEINSTIKAIKKVLGE